MDDVSCERTTKILARCELGHGWGVHNCGHNEDAGVSCDPRFAPPEPPSPPPSPPTLPVFEGDLRLVDGPTHLEGRLEVYHCTEYECMWGTICDDDFGVEEATVACRQLGMGVAERWLGSARYGQGRGLIWLDDLGCSGDEQRLGSCSFRESTWGSNNCAHSEDAGIKCLGGDFPPEPPASPPVPPSAPYHDGDVRLVGGPTPRAGRVEVLYHGVWGTVCDDGWGVEEARAVCRQLGYSDAAPYVAQHEYSTYGGIIVDPPYGGYDGGRWDYDDPTGLNPLNGSSYSYTYASGWQDCYYEADGQLRCDLPPFGGGGGSQQRPHPSPHPRPPHPPPNPNPPPPPPESAEDAAEYSELHYGRGSGPIWLDDVSCREGVGRLDGCDHNLWGMSDCSHGEDVGVRCVGVRMPHPPSPPPDPPSPPQREGFLRLRGGSQPWEGRVEIFHAGLWGTVCDDSWGQNEAETVCRQLGYKGGVAVMGRGWDARFFGEGEGPIWLDDVGCPPAGVGQQTMLSSCSHTAWGNSNCAHQEDAGVICEAASPAPPPPRPPPSPPASPYDCGPLGERIDLMTMNPPKAYCSDTADNGLCSALFVSAGKHDQTRRPGLLTLCLPDGTNGPADGFCDSSAPLTCSPPPPPPPPSPPTLSPATPGASGGGSGTPTDPSGTSGVPGGGHSGSSDTVTPDKHGGGGGGGGGTAAIVVVVLLLAAAAGGGAWYGRKRGWFAKMPRARTGSTTSPGQTMSAPLSSNQMPIGSYEAPTLTTALPSTALPPLPVSSTGLQVSVAPNAAPPAAAEPPPAVSGSDHPLGP